MIFSSLSMRARMGLLLLGLAGLINLGLAHHRTKMRVVTHGLKRVLPLVHENVRLLTETQGLLRELGRREGREQAREREIDCELMVLQTKVRILEQLQARTGELPGWLGSLLIAFIGLPGLKMTYMEMRQRQLGWLARLEKLQIFPERACEEWLGDLYEARWSWHQQGLPLWVIKLRVLGWIIQLVGVRIVFSIIST
jgi:hypothetical protein